MVLQAMNEDSRFEQHKPACQDARKFVDLNEDNQRYLIDCFSDRIKTLQCSESVSTEEWKAVALPLANMLSWKLKLQEMERLGWDMTRRDDVFFSTLTKSSTTISPEEGTRALELAARYMGPAEEAESKGRYGEANRLRSLLYRQMNWLTKDKDKSIL